MDERSTPTFSEIDPTRIPFQYQLVNDIQKNFDYSLGVHECLLSGTLGSAKSLIAAHLGIDHCMRYSRARLCIGRRSLPDLRDTIFAKIIEHLEGTTLADGTELKKGVHYDYSEHECKVKFWNGSKIIPRTWGDKRYKKLGSLEFSAAIIEELTENENDEEIAIKLLRTRVGRLPHIPVNWILYCTNPDSPAHFAYKYFDIGKRKLGLTKDLSKTRHVYFSKTVDNPFLPSWYIENAKEDIGHPKLVARLIDGEWVELDFETIYHRFSEENCKEDEYFPDMTLPIYLDFDFNIGQGKPMSMCASQFDPDNRTFHFFDESIVDGADTEGQMQEVESRGMLDYPTKYIIHGDATGNYKSTKSKLSDYDIVEKFLANCRNKFGQPIEFEIDVPAANPPIRERHNRVNAYIKNMNGKIRAFFYPKVKTLIEGMKLTALKKGGQYLEDDSKPYQHVATAAGYHIHSIHRDLDRRPSYEGRRVR